MDTRLAFLLNHSDDIFFVADTKGNIIYTNTSWTHFTEYSREECVGKNLTDFSHPADKNKFAELFQSIISLRNIEGLTARLESRSGAFLTVSWSACYDKAEQLIYASGIYRDEDLNIRNPYNISDKVQHVLASLTEGFFMLDQHWRINAFNPAFQKLVRMTGDELYGADFRLIDQLNTTDEVVPQLETAYQTNTPQQLQYYDKRCKGWLRLNIYPYKGDLIVFIRDISRIKIEQLILELEKKVLQLNFLAEYPLSKIAEKLLVGIESIFPEMYCSILEVDREQEKVYHLAAPRLPIEYCNIINGASIGPNAGSCGTAAYHREQVIVSDIANSPLWEDYKQYILPHGLKACWSTPIISPKGTQVLATFAIYYDTERAPGKDELRMIDRTINILRALIESKKNEEHAAEQTRRLQDIASISSHNIRRPVATIMGLVNLFDRKKLDNPLNRDIISHLETTALELDDVIHIIVEKTINV
ncbi:MAG TPA: PAS domain-containing protein [Mucilaginibacter sp.]|nr:PAS domain-containing protein [Mucilaginibacter sp.]